MDNLATGKRFRSLLDAVGADSGLALQGSLGGSVRADTKEPDTSALGPSVGDDQAPSPHGLTMLGPSVGDDFKGPMLGLRKTYNVSAPPCSDFLFIISNTSERPKHTRASWLMRCCK